MNAPAFSDAELRRRIANLTTEAWDIADAAIFPAAAMERLERSGILRAPLPRAFGGLGIGTEIGQGPGLLNLLHGIGQISLPLGRLLEAHVNALRIIARHGTGEQMTRVAAAVQGGALFGLWVTDPPSGKALTLRRSGQGITLTGQKMFCSGAGHVDWAVTTGRDATTGGDRLLLIALDGSETVSPLPAGLGGMKPAVTGQVDFTGRHLPAEAIIGAPGDYLREPDFSAGAWRSSAVALGGLSAIAEQMRQQLTARGRGDDPYQRARFGQVLMAREAARHALLHAGTAAENLAASAEEIVAAVGLARLLVERACQEVMVLAHRSLGLAAFLQDNPVERLTRDLQTYLRQPAADEVLHLAAGHVLAHGLPAV